MSHVSYCSARCFLVLVLTALGLLAQTGGTGAITGVVTDPAGSVVPQAELKVTNVENGETRTTVSNSSGSYLVSL